jgi:hypothetical protein
MYIHEDVVNYLNETLYVHNVLLLYILFRKLMMILFRLK